MMPMNRSSVERRDGLLRRLPGGTERASTLATILRSIPNRRAASLQLKPS